MPTIQITISGEQLAHLSIKELPNSSTQKSERKGYAALGAALQRNEVNKIANKNAGQGNPLSAPNRGI